MTRVLLWRQGPPGGRGPCKTPEKSEFLLLQPFSPLARPNLAAWLAARSDGENYGELVLFKFPSETSIFGPEQIQALINQNPIISQQFSLWDRAGSEVIQGNLLVLPIGKALIYVEPIYLKARKGGGNCPFLLLGAHGHF